MRLLTGASFFGLHGRRRPRARPDGAVRRADRRQGPVRRRRRPPCCRTRRTLASTWDEALLHEAGELLADEAVRQGVDVVLGPTINLHRTPLGGRHFECFSEDPLLTGRLAAALRPRPAGPRRRRLPQAPGRQRGRDRAAHRRRPDRRGDPARGLPAAVRDRRRRRRPVDADGRLQPASTACPRPSRTTCSTASSRASGATTASSSPTGSPPRRPAPAITGGLDLAMPGPDRARGATRWSRPSRRGEVAGGRRRRRRPPAAPPGRPGRRPRRSRGPRPADLPDRPTPAARADAAPVRRGGHDRAGQRRRAAARAPTPRVALDRRARARDPAAGRRLGAGHPAVTRSRSSTGWTPRCPGWSPYAGGVEVGSPPPARPGFVTDPVDGRPGLRAAADRRRRRGAARGARRRRPPAGRHRRRRVRARSRGSGSRPASSARGPLQLGVIGIGTWTISVGEIDRTVVVAPVERDPRRGDPRAADAAARRRRSTGPTVVDGRARARRRARAGRAGRPARRRCRTRRRSTPPSPRPATPTSRSSSWG